jgi:xanthine dehydrogenase accessory factor
MLIRADGTAEGELVTPQLACRVAGDAMRCLASEESGTETYELEGTYDVFIDVYPSPPQLIVVGASHAAEPLARFASALGYRVVVTDARAAFALPERFPTASTVIKGWPQDVLPTLKFDSNTYLVLLSHDARFDEPTLQHALRSDVRYIGAIGSRKTQRERMARLLSEGFTQEQIDRIHGPVGLDLGGRTVEEIALSIMAEITAVRRGRGGGFMRSRLQPEPARGAV